MSNIIKHRVRQLNVMTMGREYRAASRVKVAPASASAATLKKVQQEPPSVNPNFKKVASMSPSLVQKVRDDANIEQDMMATIPSKKLVYMREM